MIENKINQWINLQYSVFKVKPSKKNPIGTNKYSIYENILILFKSKLKKETNENNKKLLEEEIETIKLNMKYSDCLRYNKMVKHY